MCAYVLPGPAGRVERPQSHRSRHQDAGDAGAGHPPHPAAGTTWRAVQCVATTKPIRGHLAGHIGHVQPGRDTQISSWGPPGVFLLQVSTQALPQHAGQWCLEGKKKTKNLLPGWYSSNSAHRLVGSRPARLPSRGPSLEGGT